MSDKNKSCCSNHLQKDSAAGYSLMNMRQLHILNSAKNCFLISVFFPEFTWAELKIVMNIRTDQCIAMLGSSQVNSGENTEINKQLHVKHWLNWKKYEAILYSLSCNTPIAITGFVDHLGLWPEICEKYFLSFPQIIYKLRQIFRTYAYFSHIYLCKWQ